MEQTYRWVVSPLVSSLPTCFFPLKVKVKSELVYQFRYCHTLRSEHRPRWFHRHSVGVRSDFSQDLVITAVDQSTRSHSKLLRWCCAAWVWSPPVFLLMYWHACRGPGGMPGGGGWAAIFTTGEKRTPVPWVLEPLFAPPWWHSSLISRSLINYTLISHTLINDTLIGRSLMTQFFD